MFDGAETLGEGAGGWFPRLNNTRQYLCTNPTNIREWPREEFSQDERKEQHKDWRPPVNSTNRAN